MNSFKFYRERRKLTQKEVSIELKVSIQAISYWETGERMPSYEKLLRLADLYETSTDALLGRDVQTHTITPPISLSKDETTFFIDYRNLSEANKEAIRKNVRFLLAEQAEEKDAQSMTTA